VPAALGPIPPLPLADARGRVRDDWKWGALAFSAPLRLCVIWAGGRLRVSGWEAGSGPPACAFAPSRLCVSSGLVRCAGSVGWVAGSARARPSRLCVFSLSNAGGVEVSGLRARPRVPGSRKPIPESWRRRKSRHREQLKHGNRRGGRRVLPEPGIHLALQPSRFSGLTRCLEETSACLSGCALELARPLPLRAPGPVA